MSDGILCKRNTLIDVCFLDTTNPIRHIAKINGPMGQGLLDNLANPGLDGKVCAAVTNVRYNRFSSRIHHITELVVQYKAPIASRLSESINMTWSHSNHRISLFA